MNRGNIWTPQEEKQLMDEIKNRETMDEIAKRHGRSQKAITMRIENMIRKDSQNNVPLKDIMKTYHKTEEEVQQIIIMENTSNDSNAKMMKKISEIENKIAFMEKILIKIYKKIDHTKT